MDKVSSKWRPLKGRDNKKRQWARLHFAKIRERKAALKMQSEKKAPVKQEFVSEKKSDYSNGATSGIDIKSEKLVDGNEEFSNRTFVKEEVIIKDEKLEDPLLETTETNIANEFSLPGLSTPVADPVSSPIPRECYFNNVIEIPANYYNVRLGIDQSLQNKLSKGTFSLETVGSKIAVVFRKLPDLVPIMKECEKCGKHIRLQELEVHLRGCGITYFCSHCSFSTTHKKLLKIHIKARHSNTKVQKVHACDKCCFTKKPGDLLKKRITMFNSKCIKICPECNITEEPDTVFNSCTFCKAKYYYQCKNCKQILQWFTEMLRHLNNCGWHNYKKAIQDFKSSCYPSKEHNDNDYCEKIFQDTRDLNQHDKFEFREHMVNLNEKIEYASQQKRKEETIHSLLCKKCDAIFDKSCDLTMHLKNCDEKLKMQCKVFLTRLK